MIETCTCGIEQYLDREEHDYWETECNILFQLINDGPKENHFLFCPHCGKKIEIIDE